MKIIVEQEGEGTLPISFCTGIQIIVEWGEGIFALSMTTNAFPPLFQHAKGLQQSEPCALHVYEKIECL
jgi:hypothetical protein